MILDDNNNKAVVAEGRQTTKLNGSHSFVKRQKWTSFDANEFLKSKASLHIHFRVDVA
jgi:hypothetical protein